MLRGADADLDDLVHVRTYLSDRVHLELSAQVRRTVLQEHEPALTVVICGLYEESWVAEIEAVAVLPEP